MSYWFPLILKIPQASWLKFPLPRIWINPNANDIGLLLNNSYKKLKNYGFFTGMIG
jgi:hypothetical protein